MYEELLISGDQLPTNNPKIFKSLEKFLDLQTLESVIDQIKIAISENDHISIIEIFSKNVEGYVHES